MIARYIVLPTFVRPKVWIKQRTLPAYIICCSGWHPTERRVSFNSITNWDQYHVWCSKITWSMCIYNIQWMSILLNKILSWQTSQFLILTKISVSLIVIWVTHFWVFLILCITVIILIDAYYIKKKNIDSGLIHQTHLCDGHMNTDISFFNSQGYY